MGFNFCLGFLHIAWFIASLPSGSSHLAGKSISAIWRRVKAPPRIVSEWPTIHSGPSGGSSATTPFSSKWVGVARLSKKTRHCERRGARHYGFAKAADLGAL
jgi:hypothetical protein